MENYIGESLTAGIIRPSSSPVGVGFFFVSKKDHSLRPCIDYRGLNNITLKNKYPLPLISSAFVPLHGAVVFSKLDLRNAYHLVRIREGDEWKTVFNTPLGHFEYLVMPFGLTNAPAVFQSLVNDVLRDMLNRSVFVYLEDILIFSKSVEEHRIHVRQVLQQLLENRLYVKAEKCEFHVPSISFLGYIISQGQIEMDPAKVSAVAEWPSPPTRKRLQQFLGFANFAYRRFIRGYSQVAAPLTSQSAKRLSSRQARWALFFGRFNFSLTYRPRLPERQAGCPVPPVLPREPLYRSRKHPAAYLFYRHSHLGVGVRGMPGAEAAARPATRESPARWTSSAGDSGGPLWTQTSVPLLRRAQPAPGIRPRPVPVPAFCDPYPFLAALGPTSPWTSLPACLCPRATPPFSR